MKFSFIKDKSREEVIVYSKEKTELIEEIEQLVSNNKTEFIGYSDREAIMINPKDVHCFIAEDNKVYALTEKEKFRIRQKLYQIEAVCGENFIKINQSCIANIGKIKKFDASLSGTLLVIFKNGYTDYVARRRMREVKERLGVRL